MDSQSPSQREGTKLLTVSWTEFSITTALILLRVYTRLRVVDEKGTWALIWALAAWVFGICNTLFISFSVQHGMGTHIFFLADDQIANAMMWSWIADAFSRLSIASGKVAVVAFLQAIEKSTQQGWRRPFLYFIAISNICLNIFIVFMILFQCNPPQSLWNKNVPGTCPRRQTNNDAGFFVTAWGAFSDVVLATYPASIVWKLQMRWQTKLGLSALMGLGIFAAVCAAITCYQLHAVADTMDPTYILTPLTLWGATEMWVVIIAGSIPLLGPLMSSSATRVKSKVASQNSNRRRNFTRSIFSSMSGHEHASRGKTEVDIGGQGEFNELKALQAPTRPKDAFQVQGATVSVLNPEPSLELSNEPPIRAGSVL